MYLKILFLLSFFAPIEMFSQCGGEHYSNVYHYYFFVTPSGDTINKLNASGLYDGLHIYFDNDKYIIGNEHSHTIGYYNNGIPVGNWKLYCPDGSFSIGEYNGICMTSDDDTTCNGQSIYQRIGVWKFFDKDSNLVKTERYDRKTFKNGWSSDTYRLNNRGEFVPVSKKSYLRFHKPFEKEIRKTYYENGVLESVYLRNCLRDISYGYHENGVLSTKAKCRIFFGIKTNSKIQRFYSNKGKLIDKIKYPCIMSFDCSSPPMPKLGR